ncbi:U32 family peptidase [Vibrio lentus]|nr:U32 family peptidase [Vibrio lentus]
MEKHFIIRCSRIDSKLTTHTEGRLSSCLKTATRVNLSRELNPPGKMLTEAHDDHDVLTEVFVHGAFVYRPSSQCYSSSVAWATQVTVSLQLHVALTMNTDAVKQVSPNPKVITLPI